MTTPENELKLDPEAEIEADPEAPVEAPAVSEEELVQFAQKEGLVEDLAPLSEEDAAIDQNALDEIPVELQNEIIAGMEALLFMSDKPISLPKLRSVINSDLKINVYRSLMAKLREDYAKEMRGVEIAELGLGFQLRTKPAAASVLRKLVKTAPLKLTGSNMEVLAVVAYKQPLAKDEVDQIRGVDSGYILRNLMEKRLVKIVGRSELPGRPMLYATTHEFLELFSLKDLKSLPALHEVEAMVAQSEVGDDHAAENRLAEFGKMVEGETKILFDDSGVDAELEAIRAEIAAISTSTEYLESQKQRDKLLASLAELATQGLTLDAEGQKVPLGSIPDGTALAALEAKIKAAELASVAVEAETEVLEAETHAEAEVLETAPIEVVAEVANYEPSGELLQAAEEAMSERHAEMISETMIEIADDAETSAPESKPDPEQSI